MVLYFYPKDDTPGCTTEACEFTAGIADFAGLDAVVLGLQPGLVRPAPEVHRQVRPRGPAAVGPGAHGDGAYGAWGEKTMYGRTTRG